MEALNKSLWRSGSRIRMRPAARVAYGRNVIDIDSEAEETCHQASPREPGFTAGIAASSGGRSSAA